MLSQHNQGSDRHDRKCCCRKPWKVNLSNLVDGGVHSQAGEWHDDFFFCKTPANLQHGITTHVMA